MFGGTGRPAHLMKEKCAARESPPWRPAWYVIPVPRPHFRLFARRSAQLPALLSSSADGVRDARVLDVGLGGACVETTAGLGPGAQVTLEINTPNLWDPLVMDGAIAWVTDASQEGIARAGIRFEPGRPGGLRALVELLGQDRYD